MDLDREETNAAVRLPASIAAELAGYHWTRDKVGQSGGSIYKVHSKSDAPDLFLKHGRDFVAEEITDEMIRLHWLAGHIPVPDVRSFFSTPEEAWLLMTAIPGKTAYESLQQHPHARIAIVDALAKFLRRLHAIPISDCPFISDHTYRLARARERIDAGLVDENDFDERREGWTAEQVWKAMQRLVPIASNRVVTHGDFSLDNILICDGEVVGCIDTGRVGIADQYQDLAILWNNLGEFDASLQERLLTQYGITEVNQRKLEFHLLLDEMF